MLNATVYNARARMYNSESRDGDLYTMMSYFVLNYVCVRVHVHTHASVCICTYVGQPMRANQKSR